MRGRICSRSRRGAARRRPLRDPRPQDLVEPRGNRHARARASRARAASARRSHGLSMFVVAERHAGHGHPADHAASRAGCTTTRSSSTRCACPPTCCSGAEGEGFVALLNGLDTDRFWGRFYKAPALKRVLGGLVRVRERHARATARRSRAIAVVRRRLAAFAAELAALRLLFYRVGCMLERRRAVTYEAARREGAGATRRARSSRAFGLDLLGPLRARSAPLAVGGAGRRDPASLPDQHRPHHRGRHVGGPAHHGGHARPRPARRAEGGALTDGLPSSPIAAAPRRPPRATSSPSTARPTLVQELAARRRAAFRRRAVARDGRARLAGLLVPGALGGSDGTLLDVMLLVEEMGRACLPGPYIHSAVVATSLLLDGANRGAARARCCPRLALGERIAARWPLVEESGGVRAGGDRAAPASGGRLNGRKLFVKDAHVADDLVVVARGDGGITVFLVERDRRGIPLAAAPHDGGREALRGDASRTSRCAPTTSSAWRGAAGMRSRAALRAGRARPQRRDGGRRPAHPRSLRRVRQDARAVRTARSARSRRSSTRAPTSCATSTARAACSTRRGVEGRAAVSPAAADVAMAKAYAGEACLAVARRGHQILGAISYCEEHPLHLLHKRIHAASAGLRRRRRALETVARAIGLA